MKDSKKTRSVNFKSEEKTVLVYLITKHKDVVENKKVDSVSVREKELAWNAITEEFNSHMNVIKRTTKQLKGFYDNFKRRTKKKNTKDKINLGLFKTGAESHITMLGNTEASSLSIIKDQVDPLQNHFDSDHLYMKPDCTLNACAEDESTYNFNLKGNPASLVALSSPVEMFVEESSIPDMDTMQTNIKRMQAAIDTLKKKSEKLQTELRAEQAKVMKLEKNQHNLNHNGKVKPKKKDMDGKLSEFLKVASCAFCKLIVKSDIRECVNGHIVCKECESKSKICPTCSGEFNSQSRFVPQILNIFLTHCKYKDCSKLLIEEDDEDHEKYCSLRPTGCKWCEWKGPIKDIYGHIEDRHKDEAESCYQISFSLSIDTKYSLFMLRPFYSDQFCWMKTQYSFENNLLTFTWIPVFSEKSNCDYFITYSFVSPKLKSEFELKINVEPDVDLKNENQLVLPAELLQSFIDDSGILKLKINIEEKEKTDTYTNTYNSMFTVHISITNFECRVN